MERVRRCCLRYGESVHKNKRILTPEDPHAPSLRQRGPCRHPAPSPAGPRAGPRTGAHEAELGGATGVIVHLREDRRHIQDRDVELLAAR